MVDDDWKQIEQGYVENKKVWTSEKSSETIEQRKEAENAVYMAKTRNQRRVALMMYQELNRAVKRSCRRDNSVYVESEAERAMEAGRRGEGLCTTLPGG